MYSIQYRVIREDREGDGKEKERRREAGGKEEGRRRKEGGKDVGKSKIDK